VEKGKLEYYFQNIGYISAVNPSEKGKNGSAPVKILMIDANANGTYFDDDDMVMFNTWNPYVRSSTYHEVERFMDNFWYRLGHLRTENFITFSFNPDNSKLVMKNANSEFIGLKGNGTLDVYNLGENAKLFINGKEYGPIKKGSFESPIEYGFYNLRVQKPGRLDFRETFSVLPDAPEVIIGYELTTEAVSFVLENHNFRNWKIMFSGGTTPLVFYNQNSVSVPTGEYKVIISDGSTNFVIPLKAQAGEVWMYNFSKNKLVKK
jgi:hypothetical protein